MKKLLALASLLLIGASAQAQEKLHLYNWNNYLAPETVTRFEASCKCQVVQSYYGDNEEMLAKLAAGANRLRFDRTDR
jgi:spermidine/putrescine transport system substrate-binding protein